MTQPARAADVHRPALAILDFEPAMSGRMLAPPQLGAAAAQLLLDRLVASGAYRVFDGHWLQPGPQRPDMAPPASLRAYAAAAGADYLVIGTVTRFSEEQKRRGGGGIALPFPVLGALHRDKRDLAIDVVVRVVDARTGEIVTTASGLGVASRTNRSIGGFGLMAAAGGGGGFTNQAIGSRDAQLAEALERSITSAANGLIAAAPRLYQAQAREPR
jgi:curli biogenesis system outer membrane secretion channel CsgG